MGDNKGNTCQLPTVQADASIQLGRYVYCIAPVGEETSLGEIGIGGREVYSVVLKELCALVHNHPAQPYQTADSELASSWVLAHHRVVEAAWKRWGTVVPMTFNTIIVTGQKNAEENLISFLEEEYQTLKTKLRAFTDKGEFSIQVFWDPAIIARQVARSSAEIIELEHEITSKHRGIAYMYRQKLEGLLRGQMEAKAAGEFEELYSRAGHCVDSIRVEKTKAAPEGLQMLMNLSCLVSNKRYPDLEALVKDVSKREGYFIRLVGPLPPYSFC